MKGKLYQVMSGYFCAGIIVSHGLIIHTASILKWSQGKNIAWFEKYCERKGWSIIFLDKQ